MKKIKYFKAQNDTKRYRKNQKVWIINDFGNFFNVVSKFRGKGRLTNAMISKHSKIVGDVKEIEVDKEFWMKLYLKTVTPTKLINEKT
tara:strand:- start:798 stop:1061 length:264 start_codon:yes stop_codon:yes gene_type:complete